MIEIELKQLKNYLFNYKYINSAFDGKNSYIKIINKNGIETLKINLPLNKIEDYIKCPINIAFYKNEESLNYIVPNKKIKYKDYFLSQRFKSGFVLLDGCHIEADGFGKWVRGIEKLLRINNFNVKTTYESNNQWNKRDYPFWSIKVGPPFSQPLPGTWKTLYTCVDETGEKDAENYIGEYDEVWVPLPCQIEKIKELGYVGQVCIVKPPIKWYVRENNDSDKLIWIGSVVDRKQRGLVREWNLNSDINIEEINRWEKMLSEEEYKDETINSKGLVVTSRSEGYGMPIREFAYSGLPVYGVEVEEYEGLIFEATDADQLRQKILQKDKCYNLQAQIQTPINKFQQPEYSGFFPGRVRCGVQSHHQGICNALNIPVSSDNNSINKIFATFHELYARDFFEKYNNKNISVIDIHSISRENKEKIISFFDKSVKYIGHREDHIDGLNNSVILPLYTRAKRNNLKKENIIYHSGLISSNKNYNIFFEAAIKDRDSKHIWKIDLSIPSFYDKNSLDKLLFYINELYKKAIKNYANIELDIRKYFSDEYRYENIEKAIVCVVLYGNSKFKDSSAFINDALYLKTPCIANKDWISETDKYTVQFENNYESLLDNVYKAKDVKIPNWLDNNPEKVLCDYCNVLRD
jgi:hypothetical protein